MPTAPTFEGQVLSKVRARHALLAADLSAFHTVIGAFAAFSKLQQYAQFLDVVFLAMRATTPNPTYT